MTTFQYHYDPLDRLIQTAGIQRFYNQSRMTTELEGTQSYSVFQQDGQLLAQRRRDRTKDECSLLGTDLQQSVLHVVGADKRHVIAYNPYGHRPVENGLISLLGFNGERPDPVTGHYLLGQGHRAYNPVLMRFNSPDSLSPFGKGGLNAYAYCSNNPVTRRDPTGKSWATSIFARFSQFEYNRINMPGFDFAIQDGVLNRKLTLNAANYNFILNKYRGSPYASVDNLRKYIEKNKKDIEEIKNVIAVKEIEYEKEKAMLDLIRESPDATSNRIEKRDFFVRRTKESVDTLKELQTLSIAHLKTLETNLSDIMTVEYPRTSDFLYPPSGPSRSSPAKAASNIRRSRNCAVV